MIMKLIMLIVYIILLLVDNLDLLKDDVPTCLSLGLTPDVCKTEEEFIDSFKSVYIK